MDTNTTTGRLNFLARVLSVYADDLTNQHSTPAERDAATVLDALYAAIMLDETAELARLVKPWADARAVGAVQGMVGDDGLRPVFDDQSREDAIAAAREG
jgi:hypothetical protein